MTTRDGGVDKDEEIEGVTPTSVNFERDSEKAEDERKVAGLDERGLPMENLERKSEGKMSTDDPIVLPDTPSEKFEKKAQNKMSTESIESKVESKSEGKMSTEPAVASVDESAVEVESKSSTEPINEDVPSPKTPPRSAPATSVSFVCVML